MRRKSLIDCSNKRSVFNFEVLILYVQDYFHVSFDQFKNIKNKDQTKESKSSLMKLSIRPKISGAEFACSHGH